MTLRCSPNEIAIYIPPSALSPLTPDQALAQCRTFLEHVAGARLDVRVFDDAARAMKITPGFFFDTAEGETPAFDAFADAVASSQLSVVVIADRGALERLPGNPVGGLDYYGLEVAHAVLTLAVPPAGADLDALERGDPGAWAKLLGPLVFRRPTTADRRKLGTPRAIAEAFVHRRDVPAWCRIAWDAAEGALPQRDADLRDQAVRHFQDWLEDGLDDDVQEADPPEQDYRRAVEEAAYAIGYGAWDDALEFAREASAAAKQLPPDTINPREATRLVAAALFGRREFGAALDELAPALLLDTMFGTRWTAPISQPFEVGLPDDEDALRHVAFLFTRVQALTDPELQAALKRLIGALPRNAAKDLEAALKKHR